MSDVAGHFYFNVVDLMNSGCYNSWQWWNASIPSWWHWWLLCPSSVLLLWQNSSLSFAFPKCQGKFLPFTFNTVSNKRSQKLPQVVQALKMIIIIYWVSCRGVAEAGGVPVPALAPFWGWGAAPTSAARWFNGICVQPNPIYLTSLRRKKKNNPASKLLLLELSCPFWVGTGDN